MDQTKLAEFSPTRQWAHQALVEKKSRVYNAFLAMEHATYADAALPKKPRH